MNDEFEGLQIQLFAPVDSTLFPLDKMPAWGFLLRSKDGEDTFVLAGTKRHVKSRIDADEDLLALAKEAIRSSENDLANEWLDLALDEEEDVMVNGEVIAGDRLKAVISGSDEE